MTSLYPYVGQHRSLLLAAKEGQNLPSIELFYEVYNAIADQTLAKIISQWKIRRIVIARLRISRLASTQWHPFEFWQTQTEKLKRKWKHPLSADPFPEVVMGLSLQSKKRALVSAADRRNEVTVFDHDYNRQKELGDLEKYHVSTLILDDVLTSGGTLYREWLDLFPRRTAGSNFRAHALTLFRTPVHETHEGDQP